jgi:hypothetical protein
MELSLQDAGLPPSPHELVKNFGPKIGNLSL